MKATIKIDDLHCKARGIATEILRQADTRLKEDIKRYAAKRGEEVAGAVVGFLTENHTMMAMEMTLEWPDEDIK